MVDLIIGGAQYTGVLKSKFRCSYRLPGFTAAVFENYSKKFSTMHIISRLELENRPMLSGLCLSLMALPPAAVSTIYCALRFIGHLAQNRKLTNQISGP